MLDGFMSWILAALLSAVFLGLYDLSKKQALNGNAVVPVLFLSTLCGAVIWAVLLLQQWIHPGLEPSWLSVEPLTPKQHLMVLGKAGIVSASWICSYFGVRHLPLSLAAPIRATGPLFTFAGAILILAERPSWVTTLGIGITLLSFLALSLAGKKEGIHFHKNPWVGMLMLGTLFGACSGLYDKFLMSSQHIKASTLQAWFSLYLVPVLFPFALGWYQNWWPRNRFDWRWSIPLIALALLVADFLYFDALRNPDALIAIVSSVRRGSTLVAFAGGILLLGEPHWKRKLPAVLGIVAGITTALLG